MTTVHCFTSASLVYLDRAWVLADTVKKYHPDWVIWLCLADRAPPELDFDFKQFGFDGLVRIEDLAIPNVEQWIFSHNVVELSTAIKGAMLQHLLERGAKKVVYLDPDIALFSSLANVTELLDEHPIILTPHLTSPENTLSGIIENEIGSLKHGTYNLGFIGVNGSEEGRGFARWWRDRLIEFCYDDILAGLFTDQRWCDLVPSLFPGAYILRDPGCNVAGWNLSNRPIAISPDGTVTAAGVPLRFFHFTKLNTAGESSIRRYSAEREDVLQIVDWYRERLKQSPPLKLPDGWWAFGMYYDGEPIAPSDRILYRNRPDLQAKFPRPFDSGPASYKSWCRANPNQGSQNSLRQTARELRQTERKLHRARSKLKAIEGSTSWRMLSKFQQAVSYVPFLRKMGRRIT